jgi:hypothetical protein
MSNESPKLHFASSSLGFLLASVLLSGILSAPASALVRMPDDLPGDWSCVGRTQVQAGTNSAVIDGGYVVEKKEMKDAEFSFRARAPMGASQVQIWSGFRFRDRDSRYVFALRGGNDNDIYLARYGPDGGSEFLGFAPLDFKPVPGVWYQLRVVTLGNQIQIFLNDDKLPRLNVRDPHPLWNSGSILLGGGWLPAEFADLQTRELTDEEKKQFLAIGKKQWAFPPLDKESLRKRERNSYLPEKIATSTFQRTDTSLDGAWLFIPDYQLSPGESPVQLNSDDQDWHVMQVPSFWTPALSWLHGETGFPDLDTFSKTKGVAESLYVQRIKQCDSFTFDWRKTRSAWYRHYVELPPGINGRHFELTFKAIAKVSAIWVNGVEVGNHTGMFGQVKCDITKAVKPGRNVIAVHVISSPPSNETDPNKPEGVAVTVEVTSAMLHSLPHGMFQDDVGGIWQPVELTETAPVHVGDCFIEPGLHGADIDLDILNDSHDSAKIQTGYSITSVQDGAILYSGDLDHPVVVAAAATNHLRLVTPRLNPKPWSPQTPNLYTLEIRLSANGKLIDSYKVRFGFRTFKVEGNRFLLNGKPFWLRGADPFPNTLMPNDKELAVQFMKIAREGNVSVTRSHIVPFTSSWLDAADEVGMAVSFEGTWPWLMLEGDPPDNDLIQTWRDEFISLIRENRNHPSIILWTINNEMKFEQTDQKRPERLKKKWAILNDMIKAVRETDPTRPVVADSSYVRKEAELGYQTLVKPEGLDDGDVDDLHRYYGWYNESFFHFYDGQFNRLTTPGRPFISQEMSTGYPNNDDGHPARFYLFKNYTPQALVGDDAYENADPAIFLKRQAFMTKGLAETLRRTSHEEAAGILYFSYFTWFQSPWLVDHIKPWPAYYALKTALQPVLVSAELYGRHFYSATTSRERVCIVNDSEDCQAIAGSHLIWEFQLDGQVLSQGRVEVPAVNYYENRWLDVEFKTPQNLPKPRANGQLTLKLESNGKILSENSYDVVMTTREWAQGELNDRENICLWNPGNSPTDSLSGLPLTIADSIETVGRTNVLIIGNLDDVTLTASQIGQLKDFVSQGGQVLMLHPGKLLEVFFPDQVKAYKAKSGEIVTMHVPESPVFSGIEPLDLAWFERGGRQVPIACSGVYQVAANRKDTTALASQLDLHGYLRQTSQVVTIGGAPLVEIRIGKGRLLASELCLESGKDDPIARRLLANMIHYLEQAPVYSVKGS